MNNYKLECIGGSAQCKEHLIPKVVQCHNMGTDGYDVQWKCQAEMLSNLKFGKIDVNCEGFDYPNDKYVLKGSCGVIKFIKKNLYLFDLVAVYP